MSWKTLLTIISLIVLASCSNSSLEDYREEAEGISRSITKEIQKIQSRDELIAKTPKLKKLFDKLVDVMIAAHEFHAKHPAEIPPLTNENRLINDNLRVELTRLYTLDGARDIMEKAQQDALYRLDAYLKKKKADSEMASH